MNKVLCRIICTICFCVSLLGCHIKNNKVLDEVTLFSKEVITIPSILTQIKNYEASSILIQEGKAKMVFWFDSTSCTTCNAKRLSYLDRLYELSDNSGLFDVLLIMSPHVSEVEELLAVLCLYDLDHPICIDVNQQFIKCNPQMRDYPHCHFFLLDSFGHPQFVGNPVDSYQLWELFCTAMEAI